MNSYMDFSEVYDTLMREDFDYGAWADYIERIFKKYGKTPHTVYDLACGTGNITIELSRRGCDVTGIDISEDMLSVAANKASGVTFVRQNISELCVTKKADAVTCMIDGINYIISPRSLLSAFSKIAERALSPDGIFVFDISTRYKLETVIGDNTFIHSDKEIFYAWQNHYIEHRSLSDMFLTFFVRDGAGYRRFEERHLQRAYTEKEIRFLLNRAGFKTIDAYDELTLEKPSDTSQRIVFACLLK